MKLIKISTDLEMTIHEFPEGRRRDAGGVPAMSHEEQNDYLRKLIGNHCRIYEHVMPERLYTHLKMTDHPTNIPGQCVSMLIDEEGRLKPNTPNLIGSYLYKSDVHNQPIVGNVLFVGEEWGDNGIDFCGVEEETFKLLELELNNMIMAMKATTEVLK